MKRKLCYEAPIMEEFTLNLGANCLQTVSDVKTNNPNNPMNWGYYEDEGEGE